MATKPSAIHGLLAEFDEPGQLVSGAKRDVLGLVVHVLPAGGPHTREHDGHRKRGTGRKTIGLCGVTGV